MTGTVASGLAMAGPGARVLDFRRRPGTPPRRRRRSVLVSLARPLATALASVALPVGLAAWVLDSPSFRLRQVVVGPTARVPASWVRSALAPLAGRNLVRLSLGEAAGRVARNPWIVAVELAKELPDRLRVAVTERRPVALLRGPSGLAYADAEGQAIAPVGSAAEEQAARGAGLVVVSLPRTGRLPADIANALALAAEVRAAHPEWAAGLQAIDALGEEDFRLHTAALPCPLLVRRGGLAPRLHRFEELLPELARRYPRLAAVDLRLPRRIVVQPLSGPAGPPQKPLGPLP